MRTLTIVFTAILVVGLLAGCAGAPAEDNKLKVVLIPVLDVLPALIAQQNGYFAEQGIQVETLPVKSGQERDVLIQTGQADAMLTDLVSTGLLNKESVKVKAVLTTRRPFPGAPLFRILAGPKTDIKAPADLKGVPIGISQNTVIAYLTERMLQAEGLKAAEIVPLEVSAIPVRYEQLMNGNLKAATLPDPLAQGAIAAGARLVVDDSKYASRAQSVLSFRVETLRAKPNTVKKFLAAWQKAVVELNAHPEKYQGLLIQQNLVPKALENSYKMPPFPTAGTPSQAEISDITLWLREKGLVTRDIPFGDMVDATYLPK